MPKSYLQDQQDSGKVGDVLKLSNIQRWCILRKVIIDNEDLHLLIEVSEASQLFLDFLALGPIKDSTVLVERLQKLDRDDLDWWQERDERIFESQADFLKRLEDPGELFQDMPRDKWSIEEGMVFININSKQPMLIPFTYQARQMSKGLYKRLTGMETKDESSESSKGGIDHAAS
ncbi:hypothetical protein ACFLXB_09745 [Chloroflexota bacterium]